MTENKCPYCGKKVVSGTQCNNCSAIYHASCASRCTSSKKGVLKMCCDQTSMTSKQAEKTLCSTASARSASRRASHSTAGDNSGNNTDTASSLNFPPPLVEPQAHTDSQEITSPLRAAPQLTDATQQVVFGITTAAPGEIPQLNTAQPPAPLQLGTPDQPNSQVDLNVLLNEVRNSSIEIRREIQMSNERLHDDLRTHVDRTKACFATIQGKLSTFDDRLNSNELAANSALNNIAQIKGNIQEIITKFASMEMNGACAAVGEASANTLAPQAVSGAQSSQSSENLALEIQDRMARANNLIIYNLQEGNGDQRSNDAFQVKEILNKVGNIDTTNVSVRRIGNPSNGKPRPIIACLRSQSDVLRVLRNRNLLPRTIQLSTDKTPNQRKQLQELRAIVMAHNNSNPATRKTIKYIRGVPTVVDEAKGANNNNNQGNRDKQSKN